MFWVVCACDWGMQGVLLFGQSPMCWMLPHMSNTLMHLYAALHVCISRVIACTMGETSHISQAFGVCQDIHWMSIMLHLVPFL